VYANAAIRLAAARRWEDAEDRLGKARNVVGEDQANIQVAGYFGWGLSGVAYYYARAGLQEKAQRVLAELEKIARSSPEHTTLWRSLNACFYGIARYHGLVGDLAGMNAWTEQLERLRKSLARATDVDVYVLLARAARIAFG